ncbi:hypothetical protein FQA39_LY05943 [Lamprigera yunnana]|nr:hypothetical protein FQA39_LY05943 [Lamprigera yunnana]
MLRQRTGNNYGYHSIYDGNITHTDLLDFVLIAYLLCVLSVTVETKRGGGGGRGRGGSGRSSTSGLSKSRQSQTASNYDLYNSNQRKSKPQYEQPKQSIHSETPKASAPPAPKTSEAQKTSAFINEEKHSTFEQKPIGFEQGSKQPSSVQRPIGWDVKSTGPLNQNPSSVGHSNPTYVSGQQNYPSHIGGQQSYPSHIGNPPSYPTHAGTNYGAGQSYHPQQQLPGYQHNPNVGGMPASNPYHNNMNNMGYSPHGYGNNYGAGYGGGMIGSGFGGNRYGGYGGYGGYGIGGYGKQYGGGFGKGFGHNAYRNAFFGLLVWNLVSGFTRRPYYVYNYYNNPEKVPKEIPLPINAIVLCPENATSLCAPNTAALCTSNSTILCVTLARETVPCDNNSTLKCVDSKVTCSDGNEEDCKGVAHKNETSTVKVPCITEAYVMGKGSGISMPFNSSSDTTNLCVTTLAMPQPEEDVKTAEAAGCNAELGQAQNSTCTTNAQNVTQPLGNVLNSTVADTNATNSLVM